MAEPLEPTANPTSLRSQSLALWVVAGAILGGFLVGPFKLQPAWLWGMGGGLAGGLIGAAAGWMAGRAWAWPWRVLGVLAVLGGGFFLVWLVAGREWILTSWTVRPQQ